MRSAGDKIKLYLDDADGIIISHNAAKNPSVYKALKNRLNKTVVLRGSGDFPYKFVRGNHRSAFKKLDLASG